MRLEDGNGVSCDSCSTISVTKFTYYSYDVYSLISNQYISELSPPQANYKSYDICGKCNDIATKKIIANNANKAKGRFLFGTKCEVSSDNILPNTEFIFCRISTVIVDLESNFVEVDKNYLSFCSKVCDIMEIFKQ
jgi:hypothetical protein